MGTSERSRSLERVYSARNNRELAGGYGAVSVGVFIEGHAPPESFGELVRVTRPGGWMVFSIRDDVYAEGGFKEKQDALERAGGWRQVKMSDTFRPFPIGESSLLNRVFVCRVA